MAGIVLAGGRSSRMGEDKALLRWQGKSWLEHSIARLRACGCTPVFVSGAASNIDETISVMDEVKAMGPLGGLAAVFHTAAFNDCTHSLIIPVDMPVLTVPLLRLLSDTPGEFDAAHFSAHYFPLSLRHEQEQKRSSLRQAIQSLFAEGRSCRSMAGLLQILDTRQLPATALQQQELLNINNPEELLALERISCW